MTLMDAVDLVELLLPLAYRLAGAGMHFERANQAAGVVGVELGGCGGIDLSKSFVQDLGALLLSEVVEFLSEGPIGGWAVEQAP